MLCYVMSSHKFVSVCVIQLINKLWFEIKVHFNDLMFVLKGIDLIESMLMKLLLQAKLLLILFGTKV